MNIEDYRALCLSLDDDVEEKMPFGAFPAAQSVLAFYIGGHIFAICDIDHFQTVTLKCRPDRIVQLKEHYDSITEPFNLSPKHWIGVSTNADKLLRQLTAESFLIVKNKYRQSKSKRTD